jgi:hypothetical protein
MTAAGDNDDEQSMFRAELKRRHSFVEALTALQNAEPLSPGPFPSTEEMIREDRER